MHSAYMKKVIKETDKERRTSEEIYQSIVARVKTIATTELTEQEAHEAARNLIEFCRIMLDYKIKKQKEKARNLSACNNSIDATLKTSSAAN